MQIKSQAIYNKTIVALKDCIVSTFDDGKWLELGYMTGRIDLISNHPRLLRSLHWGDSDYEGCVLEVIPRIIGKGFRGIHPDVLRVVEDYTGFYEWLKDADATLHAELYGEVSDLVMDSMEEAIDMLDAVELNKHAARIRNGIRDDPEQAIGSAKELLESVLKAVVNLEGERSNEDMSTLLKMARQKLGLDPRYDSDEMPGRKTINRTLSNLGQIVIGVAEIRNLYGTGHGRYKSKELEIAHARLVVNAASTVATFLVEVGSARGEL